ncbi:uncharacterized protein LOC142977621 [Anticarsia gemmatalis]|uniref:uncharacterized protein LOC142977621 n=1 Tax=Anticarsia gemmatalis TaxID=129554 RepID=UPI003F77821B
MTFTCVTKKCRLAIFTQFDLAAPNGQIKGLFKLPSYSYATEEFEHKKTYYLIVLKQEADRHLSVLPQLNHENPIYGEIKANVKKFLQTGDTSPSPTLTPPQSKITAPSVSKSMAKKRG